MLSHVSDLPVMNGESGSRPVWPVRADGLEELAGKLTPAQFAFVQASRFKAAPAEIVLVPGPDGVAGAVLGLGDGGDPRAFGALPFGLPEGGWTLQAGDFDQSAATLWFCLGGYAYAEYRSAKRPPARLVVTGQQRTALDTAAAIWTVRNLINTPANALGPSELADAAAGLAAAHQARFRRIEGAELDSSYPTIAAVGRGSDRAPVVAMFSWRGSGAQDDSTLISLCGKGVCFDTGGYDLKPSASMLKMKKDMGGAANVLGLAAMLMDADLPIRLEVRLGCVENSVSGRAMRPLDVIRTRRGLTVEIGNTDAEGRLVLCDLIADACDARPALLVDCATLTGAARVAVGPDLPALFSNDNVWASAIETSGLAEHDPVWRLPLWAGYESWLDSPVADLNNVSSKPLAGAVTAALFLQRFVTPGTSWAHIDLYAWNDDSRPGRPVGGEAQAIRAIVRAIEKTVVAPAADRNTAVT